MLTGLRYMPSLLNDESGKSAEVAIPVQEVVTVEIVEKLMKGNLAVSQPTLTVLAWHNMTQRTGQEFPCSHSQHCYISFFSLSFAWT